MHVFSLFRGKVWVEEFSMNEGIFVLNGRVTMSPIVKLDMSSNRIKL